MNIGDVLNVMLIVCVALVIVLFGRDKVLKKVVEYINLAEDYSSVGSEKFNWCVSQLRSLLPKPLQLIFTEKVIGEIVDGVYVMMREFAEKRIAEEFKRVVDKNNSENKEGKVTENTQ